MKQLRDALEEYKNNQQLLDDEAQRLAGLLDERRQETRRLESALDHREQAPEDIGRSLADDRQQLAKQEENAAELPRLTEGLAGGFVGGQASESSRLFAD